VLLLAYLQPYKVVVVLGNSMHPTLKHGQIVLAKKVTKFEKGDIVVFRNDFEEIVIKRILFMPDEYYYFILENKPFIAELIYDNSYRSVLKFYNEYGESHVIEHKIPKNEYLAQTCHSKCLTYFAVTELQMKIFPKFFL
jgi:signal peptidase I